MIMSISGFVDTILVSTLKSVSITESEFVQAALTGRIQRILGCRPISGQLVSAMP